LIVGEGDGRFLSEFVKFHPRAEIDCLDASARMLALARERNLGRPIRFINASLEKADLPQNTYDLLVTHFFLDCFGENTLSKIIGQLADAAAFEAEWLIAEFQRPARGWRGLAGRWLISFMYLFFQLFAGIEGQRLIDYRPFLRAKGFELISGSGSPNAIIRSELWRRGFASGSSFPAGKAEDKPAT
jgi:ubiquinone/menaquinone biosynthesis C-methylase UbiE